MLILDLFCGAGGAAMGLHRAFPEARIIGFDIVPQRHYPFELFQNDVSTFEDTILRQFRPDFIWASPPCQAFTRYRNIGQGRGDGYPNLIPFTRNLLRATGVPYVIENVQGAPLEGATMLCGSMFEPPLDIQRHRFFEGSFPLVAPQACRHALWPKDRYPGGRSRSRTGSSRGLVRSTMEIGSWDIPLADQQRAMGIDWMSVKELSEAIPPAYSQYIMEQWQSQNAPDLLATDQLTPATIRAAMRRLDTQPALSRT